MTLHVVNTGSDGNMYILMSSDNEALVLDLGERMKCATRVAGYHTDRISGAFCGHSHSDHRRSIEEFDRAGIPVLAPWRDGGLKAQFDNYSLKAFDLVHNVTCHGVYVTHPEMGSLVYATDTEYIKYVFPNPSHLLIECNWDKRILNYHSPNVEHVVRGHMELQTCKNFIQANMSDELRTVTLIHMSNGNLDWNVALQEVKDILPQYVRVQLAEPRLEVNVDKEPF